MAETRVPVLVTGGAGYIGSHAVLALLDAGWPVVVIDDLSTGFDWAVPAGVPFAKGDVADRELVAGVVAEHKIGAVLHFAACLDVPESVQNPLKYYENNTAKNRRFIETVLQCGIGHFIFSSTAAVYGIPDALPVAETARPDPINPYGWSKLITEQMLKDCAIAYPLNVGILRYFNVAGADPEGRAGQSTEGATHLVKVALEAATGKRDHVNIYGTDFDTPDGTGVRDYIHVSDLVAAHIAALEWLLANPTESLILNCGYGRGYSVLDVLNAVEKISGRRIDRHVCPRRAGDPGAVIADNSKILATLAWRPQRDDLATIVADALAWEHALAARG